MLELNIPSPIQFIDNINGVSIYIKREDLIHPEFGGNKWRKLKYNLDIYKAKNYKTLVTFGGAFSNHIAATSSICKYYNIPCAGIIRGTYEDKNNPTLNRSKMNGMKLFHVPKLEYKLKQESDLVKSIIQKFPNPLIIPEGGSNLSAKKGVMEMISEINSKNNFDHIIIAAGTGMTATGIIEATTKTKTWVVNVLKNTSLNKTISDNLLIKSKKWEVVSDFHFGGYAKVPKQLQEFASAFYKKYHILLDPIYTSKMMFATMELARNKQFNPGEKILAIPVSYTHLTLPTKA